MFLTTVQCRYDVANFLKNMNKSTSHSSPVRARYGMSFVDPAPDWYCASVPAIINPLRAKFFRGNINIYLHFVSFLHIDTMQVFEILPQIRQEPTYST